MPNPWVRGLISPKRILITRRGFLPEKAYHYARQIEQGQVFPPVKIFLDKRGALTFNDGRHRMMAYRLLGRRALVKTRDPRIINLLEPAS